MILQTLKLTNFKNYPAQQLDLSPRLNCFVGLNGMGKTNLLDAIHFLCLCRSHTTLPDKGLVLHGEQFFRIEGIFEKNGQREKIVAKFVPNQKKEFEKNGVPLQRLADHIGQFPVVMIAPDDVALVLDGSEERRRFLDATLSQVFPEYLYNILIYNNLLKHRNALLKQFADEKRFDSALLESLDRQFPAPAQVIFEHRKGFVEEFEPIFREMYAGISADRERPTVIYQPGMEDGNLAEQMAKSLEKDRILQRTSVGPHRDDLDLSLDGFPAKKFASQGQLKSFLLALRLAQFETLRREKSISPILLLDDIFDKLDENRVRHLVGLLIERDFGQIFITDTHRERLEKVVSGFGAEVRVFEIENGRVM